MDTRDTKISINNRNLDEVGQVKCMREWKQNHAENPFKYEIPSHDLLSTEWDEIVSFGDKCVSALALAFNKYRTKAYPFDWVGATPGVILELLKNNFDDYYPKDSKSYINKYKINFVHFSENDHLTNHDSFQRRAERLIDLFKSKKKVLFLYTTESQIFSKDFRGRQNEEYENLKHIANYLHDKYPFLDFKILACHLNNDRQNTEDIININIRCDKELMSDNCETEVPEVFLPYRVAISDIVSNLKLTPRDPLQKNHIPRVTVGLILFGGKKYLKHSLPSLVNQNYPNIEYLFRDQSPDGEIYEYIKQELPEVFSKVNIEKGANLMHSGGHNALIRKMTGEYYISSSYDMLYEPDFVIKMVQEMENPENKKFGSGTCKLLQWDFEEVDHGNIERSKTKYIDSVGIGINKRHQFFDMMQNKNIYNFPYLSRKNMDVFGATAALAIYRKTALEDIAYINDKGDKEYFDELIHHLNDVDLAYRLQWAGYPCLYMPQTTVYHDRQAHSSRLNELEKSPQYSEKLRWIKSDSLFGHLVVMRKNYSKDFSWKVKFKAASTSFKRFWNILKTERHMLGQYKKFNKLKVEINKKRDSALRRKSAKDIEKYIKW